MVSTPPDAGHSDPQPPSPDRPDSDYPPHSVPAPSAPDFPLPLPLPPEIHEALANVMDQVRSLGKDSKFEAPGNRGYNFRGIDDCLNAIGPALRNERIVVLPKLINSTRETVEVGQNRTPMSFSKVAVRYRFLGPAGDWADVVVPGEAFDAGDKSISKAMSVAFRICLIQTFALPTDEPDPDSQVYERSTYERKTITNGDASNGNPSADAARQLLLNEVKTRGLDPAGVSAAFTAETGQDIRECQDAKVITDFIEMLDVPAKVTNG